MYRSNNRRRSLALYFAAVLLMSLFSFCGFAQTNAGKDFWVAQGPNIKSVRSDTARFAIVVSNLGSSAATITITNPVRATATAVINPGTVKTFFFSTENSNLLFGLATAAANGNNIIGATFKNNVYHVTSDQNVVVYSFDPYSNIFSNDAVLQLPTHALGKKYRAISYVFPTFSYNTFFSVIGTVDGTILKTYDRAGNIVDNITINKGDCFQRLNGTHLNPNADVTGWYIEASNPVGVISGSQGTAVGNSSNSSDHLSEQLLPIEALAKTYIAAPTSARPVNCTSGNCTQDVFRYVATEDNTVITTSPNVGGGVINKGQFIEIFTNVPHIVYGSKPFYGFQFMTSQLSGTPTGNIGDPALMEMPLIDQLQYQYRYVVPESYPEQYLHLLAPVGTKISIDDVVVNNINWTTVGAVNGVTYQVATYKTTAGTRAIAGDKKFGVIVTGYGSFASYGYLGGSGLQPINAGCISGGPYQTLTCDKGATSIQLNATPNCDDGSVPQISWTSEDNLVQFSNPGIANPVATVPGPGVYVITLAVTCGGNTIRCSTEIIVREPLEGCAALPPISLVPPPPVIVPTDPGQGYATNVSIGTATYVAEEPAVLTHDAPSQFQFVTGTTIVTWKVKDVYGRTVSGQQLVTVVPPPSITPPATIVVPTDLNQAHATVNDLHTASYWQHDEMNGTYWVYENTSLPTVSGVPSANQYTSNNVNAATDHVVSWTTGRDQWGRSASGTQVVRVVPPPTIVPPAMITVPTDAGENYATLSSLHNANYWQNPSTYWVYNDFALPVSSDVPANNQYSIGDHVITWSVTDEYGRTASGTQVIRVVPPPTIVAPPMIIVPTDAGQNYATVSSLHSSSYWQYGQSSGETYWAYNNNSLPTASGIPSGDQYSLGDQTITWSVTDEFGRTASGTQVVRVVPPPAITPPPAILVPTDAGQNYATVNTLHSAGYWTYGPAADGKKYYVYNNSTTPTASGVPSGNQFPSNSANAATTSTVTWTTGADQWGRSASGTQLVTVVPPPTITAPPAITMTVNSPTGTASVTNLGAATYWVYNNFSTPTNNGITNYPVGTTTVTWRVVDQFGRVATATQLITVNYVSGEVLGVQGCTPGFWKNWPQAWGCGYSFSSKFFTVFAGVTNYQKLSANLTMGEAVDMNGGKYNALVRHATAALLNACHNGVAYPYTSAQIKAATVSMFNTGKATLGSKTYTDVEKLKDEFVRGNELGCPLGQNNAVPTARSSNPALEVAQLTANVYPNPTQAAFTLQVNSQDKTTSVSVRIMDAFGRTVAVMNNVSLGKAIIFGEKFASGAYYAEVTQGDQRKMIQLVKAK